MADLSNAYVTLDVAGDPVVSFDLGGFRLMAHRVTSARLAKGEYFLVVCEPPKNGPNLPQVMNIFAGADSLPKAFATMFKQCLAAGAWQGPTLVELDAITQVAWHHLHLARLADAVIPLLEQRQDLAAMVVPSQSIHDRPITPNWLPQNDPDMIGGNRHG